VDTLCMLKSDGNAFNESLDWLPGIGVHLYIGI